MEAMGMASSSSYNAAISTGSQCASPQSNSRHIQSMKNHRKQGFSCEAHSVDTDFLFDAALAATAAAAAVIPMYWLYVHSARNSSTKSGKSVEFPAKVKGNGLSGLGSSLSEEFHHRTGSQFDQDFPPPQTHQDFQHRTGSQFDKLHQTAVGLQEFQHTELRSDNAYRRQGSDLVLALAEKATELPIHIEKVQTQTREHDLAKYDRLIRMGKTKESLEILEKLEENGNLDMNKVYHVRFYQECRKQLAIEEAFRYTRLIRSPTLSTFNMLLSVCCTAADTNGAFGAFAAMKQAGFKPDCMIYTTLISTCAKAQKTDLLFQVLHEMHSVGIEPNAHTYGAIIDGCARVGDLAKAFGIFKTMISKNVKPDRVIFNSLINACSRSGAVGRAFEVFAELLDEHVHFEPNHITMCSLIHACSRGGDEESAYKVYTAMRERGSGGSPEPYTAAVHACSHSGNYDRAVSIYNDMKRDGVQPDEVFFSAMMDVAGHAGKLDLAFDVLQEVERHSIVPGSIIFSSLMGVCSNTGNWEKALVLQDHIMSLGIPPTVSTLNALVTALCRGKQFEHAIQSLDEMKQAGVAPNQLTYTILLEACEKSKKVNVALTLYTNALAEGILPNVPICDSMIGICLEGIRSCIYPPKLVSSIHPSWIVGEGEKMHKQWISWALAVYRKTIVGGETPTLPVFSRLLGCLRIPETSDSIGFALQTMNFNKHLVEGFRVYDPRASALYEEAAALGIVPAFQCDAEPIVLDADSLPLYSAEVCVITIMKALKHRCGAGVELPSIIIKFTPYKKSVILADKSMKTITVASRNGQAIASLLRRLRLPYNGRESSGRISVSPGAISQWFKPAATTLTHMAASTIPHVATTTTTKRIDPSVPPSSSMLGKGIADQQRAIRMGTPLPSEERRGSSSNYRFRKISRQQGEEY